MKTTKKPTHPTQMPIGDQKLLTRRDVAIRWACCEHTVARCEELKPIRFNKRRIRYQLKNVEAVEAAAGQEGIPA